MAQEMEQATTILDKLRYGLNKEEHANVDPNILATQLHINVDRYRAVEGLFQPAAILGIEQAGLIESIEELLRQMTLEDAAILAQNIFITGGLCQLPGLEERLYQDIRMIRPEGSKLIINRSNSPSLDAWKGAATLIRDRSSDLPWITRDWYNEHGGDRLPAHSCFTNQF